MIKIITREVEIISNDHRIHSAVASMDSIYLKFGDGTELTIPAKLNPMLKAGINMLTTSTAENVVIDLTHPTQPLRFAKE